MQLALVEQERMDLMANLEEHRHKVEEEVREEVAQEMRALLGNMEHSYMVSCSP